MQDVKYFIQFPKRYERSNALRYQFAFEMEHCIKGRDDITPIMKV